MSLNVSNFLSPHTFLELPLKLKGYKWYEKELLWSEFFTNSLKNYDIVKWLTIDSWTQKTQSFSCSNFPRMRTVKTRWLWNSLQILQKKTPNICSSNIRSRYTSKLLLCLLRILLEQTLYHYPDLEEFLRY